MSSNKLPIYTAIIASLCFVTCAQDSNYFFADPQGQYVAKEVSPFRQSSPGLTYTDLETSDVPIHLRQTLPKYRFSGVSSSFTTKEPRYQNNPEYAYTFQPTGITSSSKLTQRKQNNPESSRKYSPVSPNQPTPFRPSIIKPHASSLPRPNYSHLYSQQHIRDPSQTETFLGQITIQSPAELPPEFNGRGFRPSLEFPLTTHNNNNPFEHKNPIIDKNNELVSLTDFHSTNFDYNDKQFSQNTVQLGNGERGNFLNHRTRIFAPNNNNDKSEKSKSKAYFINSNGDVQLTTRTPFVPKLGNNGKNTIAKVSNLANNNPKLFDITPTNPSAASKKSTTENLHFASLLEDPINNDNINHADDDVQVIKSVTLPPDQFYTIAANPTEPTNANEEDSSTDVDYVTEDYDDEHEELEGEVEEAVTHDAEHNHNDEPESTDNENEHVEHQTDNLEHQTENLEHQIKDVDHETQNVTLDTEDAEHVTEEHNNQTDSHQNEHDDETHNEDHDVDDETEETEENIAHIQTTASEKDFPDVPVTNTEEITTHIDKTDEIPTTLTDTETEEESTITNDVIEDNQTELIHNNEVNSGLNLTEESFNNSESDKNLPEGAVVSVVTTKSVVNNTMIVTATPTPQVTEQMYSSDDDDDDLTTESWIVIASVQTSRSVSGARYLPSSIVEQEERTKYLNEPERSTKNIQKESPKNITSSTTIKPNTSTESLTDKLDRQQSDLSSDLLTGGFKDIPVLKEGVQEKPDESTTATGVPNSINSTEVPTTTQTSTTTQAPTSSTLPPVIIRKFSPNLRRTTTQRPRKLLETAKKDNLAGLLPPGFINRYLNKKTTTQSTVTNVNLDEPQSDEPAKNITLDDLKGKIQFKEIAGLLPTGYKVNKTQSTSNDSIDKILSKAKSVDISGLLPPGYKSTTEKLSTIEKPKVNKILEKAKPADISAFLPPGYKPTEKPKDANNILSKAEPVDISAFLPLGYKPPKNVEKSTNSTKRKPNIPVHAVDSSLLPAGYKPQKSNESTVPKATPVDISSLLPPGYKAANNASTGVDKILDEAAVDDISAFLPPGYKQRFKPPKTTTKIASTTEESVSLTTQSTTTTTTGSSGGFKLVFPSRPGAGTRKSSKRLTTPKPLNNEGPAVTAPAIQKGWPSRATTEFTGWPTPSTTPISIEKLLEAARSAASSTTTLDPTITLSTSTTTSTTTTTTPKPTTPGICSGDCDIIGTIKLVGGAKWVPELLDRNTKEYQILANEVQSQLENVYSKSNSLNKWYKSIKIDGFSKGSILVDYLVELNDVGKQIDTLEIKRMFHESLEDAFIRNTNREPKSKDLSEEKLEGKYSFGNFVVDPQYTDFVVLPKQTYPTVGYADDDVLLPQWAIAVIVIGLASLLFVIIFGVTVLVNRQKNSKKKQPTALTEDMLNELNKNHMGGFENYGADDLYNMEDVWNEKAYDTKLPKKKSTGSIHDNSTSNLYDSWRSEWNGYYYNAYYANNPGSTHGGGYAARRKSDYDTNF